MKNNINRLFLLFLLLSFASCSSSKNKENKEANPHPNIVIIYVDDLGYADVGSYGAKGVETPNVDRLARKGLKFTDAHCAAATCTPSRYSLLTGEYKLCQNLSWIFNQTKDKTSALIRLAKWDEKVRQAAFKSFGTISRTMSIHYKNILNYFDNRSTNASAESFNAKIKAFRAQFRGVRNIEFFLFRLSNIFA